MWGNRYFAPRYWPDRYWGQGAASESPPFFALVRADMKPTAFLRVDRAPAGLTVAARKPAAETRID